MKKLIMCLFALICSGMAQDSLIAMTESDDSHNDSLITMISTPVSKLNLDDYKKFYIGFSSRENSIEVLTLDIKHAESADSAITFHYTINTHDNREDGTGHIWPNQSRIRFQNYEEGSISLPEDGKIVFESVSKDTLNYWKLKEK